MNDELEALRNRVAVLEQGEAVLAGDLQHCQMEHEQMLKVMKECRGYLALQKVPSKTALAKYDAILEKYGHP